MRFLIYLFIFVALFILYVRYLERNSVFFPEKEIPMTPQDVGLTFEDVYFKAQDGIQLNGWLIKASEATETLIFFHGNAGNISGRLGKIQLFHQIKVNVFIVDYRGYGKSEGVPSEQAMYKDAVAAYDYLAARDDIDSKHISTYGASLGGAAAIDLATKRPLAGIIIDSSFSNAADMAKTVYPFIPSFLLSIKLDSLSKIKDVKVPKLFFHSRGDQTVPFRLGRKLFDAAGEPKTFIEITGDHNDDRVEDAEKFLGGIKEFLGQL